MREQKVRAKWIKRDVWELGGLRRRRLTVEFLEPRHLFATLHVGAGAAFATIQQAVDHARPDDIIEVAPAVYFETVDWSQMGSAISRGPGNLTIHGADSNVIVRAPQGSAIHNSSPVVGNLSLRQLIIESPTLDSGMGVALHQVQGTITIANAVFREIAKSAVELSQTSGALVVIDNQFIRVGAAAEVDALQFNETAGSATIHDNTFDEVAGGALSLVNRTSNILLMVDDNTVLSDVTLNPETDTGFSFRFAGSSVSDVVVVNNQIDGIGEIGLTLTASESARLQWRLTDNNFANVQGTAAVHIELQESARVAMSADSNVVTGTLGSGFVVVQQDASQLDGIFLDNLFLDIGNDPADQGLAITSSSSGIQNLRIHNNEFATVSGDGVVLIATGGELNAAITDNIFTEVDRSAGAAAVAAVHIESAAAARLLVKSNTVLDGGQDAYFLKQLAAEFRLEGTLATPQLQIEADNIGSPIRLEGAIQLEAPGPLAAIIPLLLGDFAWFDSDGDGILSPNESELSGMTVLLTGTATSSGAVVNRETLTDSRGKYLFSALLPGSYTLSLIPPQGRSLVQPNQGSDDLLDSDFDRATRSAAIQLLADELSIDAGLWANWQNPINRLDVDNDSLVVPRDVLLIINDLNAQGARALPEPFPDTNTPRYYDVDGNGFISPLDVLQVINFLNAAAANGEAEGEAESDTTSNWSISNVLFGLFGLEESSETKTGQPAVVGLLRRRRSS